MRDGNGMYLSGWRRKCKLDDDNSDDETTIMMTWPGIDCGKKMLEADVDTGGGHCLGGREAAKLNRFQPENRLGFFIQLSLPGLVTGTPAGPPPPTPINSTPTRCFGALISYPRLANHRREPFPQLMARQSLRVQSLFLFTPITKITAPVSAPQRISLHNTMS